MKRSLQVLTLSLLLTVPSFTYASDAVREELRDQAPGLSSKKKAGIVGGVSAISMKAMQWWQASKGSYTNDDIMAPLLITGTTAFLVSADEKTLKRAGRALLASGGSYVGSGLAKAISYSLGYGFYADAAMIFGYGLGAVGGYFTPDLTAKAWTVTSNAWKWARTRSAKKTSIVHTDATPSRDERAPSGPTSIPAKSSKEDEFRRKREKEEEEKQKQLDDRKAQTLSTVVPSNVIPGIKGVKSGQKSDSVAEQLNAEGRRTVDAPTLGTLADQFQAPV
jgi:hypothetical protein